VLETMLWPDEVRAAEFKFLDEDVDLRPQELKMASSLIDSMEGDFDPTEYTDAYREAIKEIIDAKVEGKEIVAPEQEEAAPAASDLLSALRASVEAAKKGRSGGTKGSSGSDDGTAKPAPKPKAGNAKSKPGNATPKAKSGGGSRKSA
jgi:DNA end-binding protein Ku